MYSQIFWKSQSLKKMMAEKTNLINLSKIKHSRCNYLYFIGEEPWKAKKEEIKSKYYFYFAFLVGKGTTCRYMCYIYYLFFPRKGEHIKGNFENYIREKVLLLFFWKYSLLTLTSIGIRSTDFSNVT